MNSVFRSFLWLTAAGASLFFGLKMQKDRALAALQQEYSSLMTRASDIGRETALVKEKLLNSEAEKGSAGDLELAHNTSLANIAAEQKNIEALLVKWTSVEAERSAVVQAAREKESTRPPADVILADGTKLEKFVVRSVPSEDTVAVEHASGIVKLSADKLPVEIKDRLALGWKPEPPPRLTMDRQGNIVVKQAERIAQEKESAAETDKELRNVEVDSTNIGGVTRALAQAGSQLEKAEKALQEERANIRRLGIFKSEVTDKRTGKTYAQLKKEANSKLASLAGRIKALRAEKNNLEHKLKSM